MEIIIMKTIAIGCIILLSIVILFFSCNDKPNIQQAYDFSLSHWYLQKEIRKDESVEIRFTLHRSGNYQDAKYYIGYIQMAGKGEVYDQVGKPGTSRTRCDSWTRQVRPAGTGIYAFL